MAMTRPFSRTQPPKQSSFPEAVTLRRRLQRTLRSLLCLGIASAMLCAQAGAAYAVSLIRDSEIEALIADYATPIFRVAGLGSHGIQIHIVNDRSFNAFVIDGQNMFIHTGAILKTDTPNQLIGVIAHETGHISGAHVAQRYRQAARMQSAALILNILSIGAMVGGAVAGSNEISQGGAAGLYAGGSVLQRSMLSYARGQESAADRAAVSFLTRTRQSPAGMLETFRQLGDQSLGTLQFVDPYLQTHPLLQSRIADLRSLAESSPYFNEKDPPRLQFRHDMVKAKLLAFTNRTNPRLVFRTYPEKNRSMPARYARAVARYFVGGIRSAGPDLDALIADQPDNPYFYEIKGQFLLESGKPAAAIAPLRKAVSLAPEAGLMRVMLGQAMVASGDRSLLRDAQRHLQKALVKEKQSVIGYRQLAIVYSRLNRKPEAELASARSFFYEGNANYAKIHAERAIRAFPEGSPNWMRANDIINDVAIYKKMKADAKK